MTDDVESGKWTGRFWSLLLRFFVPSKREPEWMYYTQCPRCGEASRSARWRSQSDNGYNIRYNCPECGEWVGIKEYNAHRADRIIKERESDAE